MGGGRCVAGVGGAGDFVGEDGAGGALGVGAAGDADGEGVVGDALVDGGILTVPWGWDLATPGGGSRGHCWPVCWPWRCWPCLVSGPSLVSLMPMVLQAFYRLVSPCWVSLTFRVAVAEVALSVLPVSRPLRALLRFTASLMLLMLLVVGVGPCVGGQWLVFGGGSLVMPLVRVLQALVTVWWMGSCAIPWWRGCCC